MSIIGNPIMVGGGGKNISSIIITGLKSTDTITCTKDGKSYTATWDSTAQHWEVVGLPLGTFTVTATDGTKTTTETVVIDVIGVYEIEMTYLFYLYKNGDECTKNSGGWNFVTSGSTATGENTGSVLYGYAQPSSYGNTPSVSIKTKNQINFPALTTHTTLKIKFTATATTYSSLQSYGQLRIGSFSDYLFKESTGSHGKTENFDTTKGFSISSLPSGNLEVYLYSPTNQNNKAIVNISEIWIE